MPTVSPVAEPNVAIVRVADDVALVSGSVIMHAHVPIDVHIAIDVDTAIDVQGTSVYVRAAMASSMAAAGCPPPR